MNAPSSSTPCVEKSIKESGVDSGNPQEKKLPKHFYPQQKNPSPPIPNTTTRVPISVFISCNQISFGGSEEREEENALTLSFETKYSGKIGEMEKDRKNVLG